MNKEEILAMEAGRMLNRLVTEKVIGLIAWEEKRGGYTHIVFQKPDEREPYRKSRDWEKEMDRYKRIEYSEINNHIHVVSKIMDYSTDISAAWEMEETLYAMSTTMGMTYALHLLDIMKIGTDRRLSNIAKLIRATPEQRCKAALLAVMDS